MNVPARARSRRWSRLAAEAGVALLALVGLHAWLTRDVVSGPMPALEGSLLDGRPAAEWRAQASGRAHVVYVWATWCGVCRAMRGNLDAVAADSAVITVAMRSGDDARVRQYLAEQGLRWPTVNDPRGENSRRLGVVVVPMLLFVDDRGEIRAVSRGYTTEPGIRARLWWAARAAASRGPGSGTMRTGPTEPSGTHPQERTE